MHRQLFDQKFDLAKQRNNEVSVTGCVDDPAKLSVVENTLDF
jgi:hypothetical protein